MYSLLLSLRTAWIIVLFLLAVVRPHSLAAQPRAGDPPVTYEVQVDGESFLVEGNQRPIKVESKLKQGTTYTLAVRVAMTQPLRLNSVQMEYGMWATVIDNHRKDLRTAEIVHDLGFSLTITDLGPGLDAKRRDQLLKTIAEDAEKRFADRKATNLTVTEANVKKFGSSDGKWLRINYTDSKGVLRTCMIFVLSGERYTLSAVAEFRDQDKEDVGSWVMNVLTSVQPLH